MAKKQGKDSQRVLSTKGLTPSLHPRARSPGILHLLLPTYLMSSSSVQVVCNTEGRGTRFCVFPRSQGCCLCRFSWDAFLHLPCAFATT